MLKRNLYLEGIPLTEKEGEVFINHSLLTKAVNKLVEMDSAASKIVVDRYKSGRYYAKVSLNGKYMFTCGLEKLNDGVNDDYGCQFIRIGKTGWTRESIKRFSTFLKVSEYFKNYVRATVSAVNYLV